MEGRLRWFDLDKRFGIIDVPEKRIRDVLCHQDVVQDFEKVKDLLVPGVRIQFYLQTRLRAQWAKVILEEIGKLSNEKG
jgi:cold shock CspA family protein